MTVIRTCNLGKGCLGYKECYWIMRTNRSQRVDMVLAGESHKNNVK